MQIQSIDAVPLRDAEYNRANEAWYKVGDWHDTFMYPVNNTDPITKFKYAADQFSGHMIFHCHMLNHEGTCIDGDGVFYFVYSYEDTHPVQL